MIRKGIPMPLRCAVWLSNVIQASYPHQQLKSSHEYRTLAKVRVLDCAYDSLWLGEHAPLADSNIKRKLGQGETVDSSAWVTFGHSKLLEEVKEYPPTGQLALQRVLYALEFVLGVEYAPMIPTLASILLGAMSESYVFTAIREMAHNSTWYWPCSLPEHVAYGRTFLDVLSKLHPGTAQAIHDLGVGQKFSDAIFQDFFMPLLPEIYCLRIMDIYTLEGSKVLFRFGVALAVLFHKEWKVDTGIASGSEGEASPVIAVSYSKEDAENWWARLVEWTKSSDHFDFDLVLKKAYGVHGKGVRKRYRFPRRPILSRILKLEEERYLQRHADRSDEPQASARPLGIAENDTKERAILEEREMIIPKLVQPPWVRSRLAEWLPISLRMTKLELIYSTDHHGRTLESFYQNVQKSKHTLMLIQPLEGSNNVKAVGMYASQTWVASRKVYGDGSCFLFRLAQDDDEQDASKCWKWKPKVHKNEDVYEEEGQEANNVTALLEQFQVSTRDFISMGGNANGTSGLRLNEDLTKADSASAAGFDNEPLVPGRGMFEVGLVEVYRLVRSIDGVPVA
jgi:hypothetical protein